MEPEIKSSVAADECTLYTIRLQEAELILLSGCKSARMPRRTARASTQLDTNLNL